jgi:hypothetical protein
VIQSSWHYPLLHWFEQRAYGLAGSNWKSLTAQSSVTASAPQWFAWPCISSKNRGKDCVLSSSRPTPFHFVAETYRRSGRRLELATLKPSYGWHKGPIPLYWDEMHIHFWGELLFLVRHQSLHNDLTDRGCWKCKTLFCSLICFLIKHNIFLFAHNNLFFLLNSTNKVWTWPKIRRINYGFWMPKWSYKNCCRIHPCVQYCLGPIYDTCICSNGLQNNSHKVENIQSIVVRSTWKCAINSFNVMKSEGTITTKNTVVCHCVELHNAIILLNISSHI